MTVARRPLRICYLLASLDIGGCETQMVELARRLPKDRFSVDFVLLTHRGVLAPVAEEAGARLRLLGWARRRSRYHWLRWPLDLARLGPAIRAGHYDILDAWMFHAYGLAALTLPISRVPVFVTERQRLSDFKGEFGPAERLMDWMARRSEDVVVANAEAVKVDVAGFEEIDPRRIRVIRNGVLIPPPMKPEERESIRRGWGFGPEQLVIGCVANYKLRKGLEAMLRVIAQLRPGLPELRLVLVGEGGLRPELERLIAELNLGGVALLHGREPDARRLYGAFDIAAHASETEGSPNAVVEAAAAGLPIVATRAGGTGEIFVDGESGSLVAVGDDEALARELRMLAEDPDLRRRYGTKARERVSTVFGMDRLVAEYAALYEELAERKGVRR
jgi:glycosyltransferase involved in cell wall biosynthesis